MVVGRWFNEAPTKDGGKRFSISERNPDGTFVVRFRVIEASGKVWEQTELGFWGVDGPIYFTITRGFLDNGKVVATNPMDPTFYDAYEILELTESTMRYRSVGNADEFTTRRVPQSFEFPK